MTRQFPWDKTGGQPSFPWNTPQQSAPSYPWENNHQSYQPAFNQSFQQPGYQQPRYQQPGYQSFQPAYQQPAYQQNPYSYPQKWQSSGPATPPSQTHFPWESNPFYPPSAQKAPEAPSNLFVFGKEQKKESSYSSFLKELQQKDQPAEKKAGSYSSFLKEMKEEREKKEDEKVASKPASYSSLYKDSKQRALFPWEKKKEGEDEVDGGLGAKLAAEDAKAEKKEEEKKKEEVKEEKKADEADVPPPPKSPKSPKKKSPRSKTAAKKKTASAETKTEGITEVKVEIPLSAKSDEKPEKPPDPPQDEEKESIAEKEIAKAKDPAVSVEPEVEKKEDAVLTKEERPITSPEKGAPLSRSSSVTKLATKPRVKSAPSPTVPRHINKKSEMLAKNYLSAYAKPKIPPKKGEEKPKDEPRANIRREVSMSEWVYPAPPEPVDWKARSDQGLPINPPPTTTVETEPAAAADGSTASLDSASLREAAFQKWIAKKKENKTLKKADLEVTVIPVEVEGPSAEQIRQEQFERWYRERAVSLDKKGRQLEKEKEEKEREKAEAEATKKKNEELARRQWEEKDKERKQALKEKKAEAAKLAAEKEKEEEEKKTAAAKNFTNWKSKKDPVLKEGKKKQREEERKKEEAEREEREMKEMESQKSFKAWKENKEADQRRRKVEEEEERREKQRRAQQERRAKETARARALDQWNARKEEEKAAQLAIPDHVSPWKNGPGKANISRDQFLLANIKHNKAKKRPGSAKPREDSDFVSEVEFVR